MYVLGISCFYHDSAAAILKDGEVLAAVEEERFTRKKHTSDFPENSIKYCLETACIEIDEIDYVGFYEIPQNKFNRLINTHLYYFPRTYPQFRPFAARWLSRNMQMEQFLRNKLGYKNELIFIDHHVAHAASAFLPSGFDEADILTIDGVGEWTTTAQGIGRGNTVKLSHEIKFPHSLGLLYSAVTSYLGFKINNGEGKVMGLASYGKPRFREEFKNLIDIRDDGSFRLNMDYFKFHYGLEMTSNKFDDLFKCRREQGGELTDNHYDLAATLQHTLETAILRMADSLHKQTGLKKLCVGGGVGLNSVVNGKILMETPVEEIFIQPASSDAGSALGCVLYIWNCILDNEKKWKMSAYTGYEASGEDVKNYLDSQNIKYEKLDEEELLNKVAKMVADDKIVGWYQGRMEFGPRALGNRSILANPANPDMKDVLNSRVKFREPFRPYAASALEDNLGDFFDSDYATPYMLLVYNVLKNKQDAIPAVTHVDGTCRIQSVTPESNRLFYKLIRRFYEITGIPMILNTSFNIRGEPIVRDIKDAVSCYLGTGMDALAACSYLLVK